jgi:hypothetical protein
MPLASNEHAAPSRIPTWRSRWRGGQRSVIPASCWFRRGLSDGNVSVREYSTYYGWWPDRMKGRKKCRSGTSFATRTVFARSFLSVSSTTTGECPIPVLSDPSALIHHRRLSTIGAYPPYEAIKWREEHCKRYQPDSNRPPDFLA